MTSTECQKSIDCKWGINMKKILSLLICIALTVTLVGCGSRFDDSSKMANTLETGVWYTLGSYGGGQAYEKFQMFSDGECISIEIARPSNEDLVSFFQKEITANSKKIKSFTDFLTESDAVTVQTTSITYEPKEGVVFSNEKQFASVTDDGKLLKDGDSYRNLSGFDTIELYFTQAYEKYFENTYGKLDSAMTVQFNKYGYLGSAFLAKGTAQISDYYNWFYSDLSFAYYCVELEPEGGSYSNRWYLYGDRSALSGLYEKLKSGQKKNVACVCRMYSPETGTNNMATIVDYYIF